MLNRPLRTEDFVRIALTSDPQFNAIYTQMTPAQCEEFVDDMHPEFLVWGASNPQRRFIFRNTSTEKLLEIFLNKISPYIQPPMEIEFGQVLGTALRRFSNPQLIQILFTPTVNNEIYLPLYIYVFSLEEFIQKFSHNEFKECLNQFATLQNNEGKTYIHMLVQASYRKQVEFILESLDDKTFDKFIGLKISDSLAEIETHYDAHQNFVATTIANRISIIAQLVTYLYARLVPKIHPRAIKTQTALGTTHYYDVAIDFCIRYFRYALDRKPHINYVFYLAFIRIFIDSIKHRKLSVSELTRYDVDSNAPFVFNLVITLYVLYKLLENPDTSNDEVLSDIQQSKAEIKQTFLNLFEKIPAKVFYETLEKFRSDNKYYQLTDKFITAIIISNLRQAFDTFCYIPYLYIDPIKFFQLLNYKSGREYFRSVNLDLNTIQVCLLDPGLGVVNPDFFCEIYQKIINHQIGLGKNCNPQYLNNLNIALNKIKTSYFKKYPEIHHRLALAAKRIQTMIILLQHASQGMVVTANKALELYPSLDMSTNLLQQSADWCMLAKEGLANEETIKTKLEINALKFLRLSTFPYSYEKPEPVIVPDEKNENAIVSLDEEHIKSELGYEDSKVIMLFNNRVHTSVTDIADGDYTVSHSKVDEDTFHRVNRHHLINLRDQYLARHEKHLKEFSAYIKHRETRKPFLFINTRSDYELRKAYYDSATKKDETIEDMANKIKIVDKAIKDPKFRYGFSHRCLDFLKLLKEDFELRLFLLEAGMSTDDVSPSTANVLRN